MLLKKGSRGANVKYLQYGLRIMCINPGSLDGIFGEGTYNAVIKFQRRFGLSADGIVGDGTWNKLKDQIRPIQSALNNHNYKLTVDGVAGDATYNAVRKIQRDHGLTDDGMVGNNTWKLLRATSSSSSSSHSKPDKNMLLSLINYKGIFNYIPVHFYTFNHTVEVPSPHPNVKMSASVSLTSTIGNADMTIDLNNKQGISSCSLYSQFASMDFSKNSVANKNKYNLLKAIDNFGIKLGNIGNGTLRLKFMGDSLNDFTIILEHSYSLMGTTIYEMLIIRYKDFQNPNKSSVIVRIPESAVIVVSAVALIGLAVFLGPAAFTPVLAAI